MSGENKTVIAIAVVITVAFLIGVWVAESHETARACMAEHHTPDACSRWGKP